MTETGDLIERLTSHALPVRPLPSPGSRAALWLAMVIAAIAGLVAIDGPCPNLMVRLGDPWYRLALASAALTGMTAGAAAFFTSMPDRSRLWVWAPVPTLLAWAGAVGGSCLYAPDPPVSPAIAFNDTLHCAVVFLMAGGTISALLLGMLRRAPLSHAPAARWLAGLAVGGLTTAGFSLTRTFAEPAMMLFWNGAAAMIATLTVAVAWRRGPQGRRAAA